MNTSRVLTLLLVLVAVFVFVVAMFFFFGKKESKTESEESKTTTGSGSPTGGKVLNVVTYLSADRVNQLKGSLGESHLFDARSKLNYEYNGYTVSVVSSELQNYPGYKKYDHTLPKPFKGDSVVFDAETSNHFYEDPVVKMSAYWWFDTLLFLTLTTETTTEPKVKKYYHYTVNKSNETLRWDRFVRDPTKDLDAAFLGPKLDELNLAMGNVVALNLDEFVDANTGTYTTEVGGVRTTFDLFKRSSSQTGFVKLTHKLSGAAAGSEVRPFKLRSLSVSGTELTDLTLTNKPVASVSVFWWYNVPLLAELELHGGDKLHLSYNVDTNTWEAEFVDKLRSKLFLLKNRLGDPLTLDLAKAPESDLTYISNGVLVRVTPGATSVSKDFKKFTHRFTSGSAHFVGSFVNAGTPQMGLPVVRLNEVSAYYLTGVPVLLKLNLATAGSLANKYRYYSNNGYGVWSLVNLTEQTATTESLLKKFVEEARKLVADNDKYVLDARMKSNYLSQGKLVRVVREDFSGSQGFSLFNHKPTDGTTFKFEKFTVAGKDVAPSAEEMLEGADYGQVYWFMEDPLLLNVHGTTVPGAPQEGETAVPTTEVPGEFNQFFSFNAETKEWKKVERELKTQVALNEYLQEVRTKYGTVTLNLANSAGQYTSGSMTVNVVEATPFENDPPPTFTKRVHTLTVPYPVDNFKHFDFDLVLAKKDENHYNYAVPVNDPLLPVGLVVTKMEVYFSGDVPLHFVVYSDRGTPYRYSNTFRGTLWMRDTYSDNVSLSDLLVPLRYNLSHFARLDVCKDAPLDTQLTYNLKYLSGKDAASVTLTRTAADENGVTTVTHKMPENVNLKFTTLTCGDKLLTGLGTYSLGKVLVYQRNNAPMFVKANSDPQFFVASGDGTLKKYAPPDGAATLTDERLAATVTELAKKLGNYYDVDVLKKQDYDLLGTSFTVTKTEEKSFSKYLHKLKETDGGNLKPFVVREFKHGDRDGLLFPTGLQVLWFAIFFHQDKPLYLRFKTHGETPKFYHYVFDNGLWLSDGTYERFDQEEVLDRLEFLKEGLGNQFSLNLGEDVDNPLFRVDTVNFDLVPGYVKHTFKPVGLDYPLLLQNLTLEGQNLNLPLVDKHLNLFTAFSFRNNYLFFHAVSHENKNLFFKADFQGGFVPVVFDTFDDVALKNELLGLRSKLANQFSLELTKKESYPYHNFNVKVVKQTQVRFQGYEKYLHDLMDGETSVPFNLVSVKNNGYVTNVPQFKELVYFAYVYMYDNNPLLLELQSSTRERTDYHYYYFTNNLGNWQMLQNPTLAQMSTTRLNEVLDKSKDQLARTFKLDLARKFSYKFTNGADDKFYLESVVGEDPRVTAGFTLYGHTFTLKKGKAAVEGDKPPTAENLGGVTVVPAESRPATPLSGQNAAGSPGQGEQQPAGDAAGSPGAPAGPAAPVPAQPPTNVVNETSPADPTTTPVEVKPAGSSLAPRAAVPATQTPVAGTSADVVEPPSSGQTVTSTSTEPVLTTYETLLANAFRGVNLLAGNLPVFGKVTVGDNVVSGFGVDTVQQVNVYWWHDQFPAFVHLYNGNDHKYYAKEGDGWVLVKKVGQALARSALGQLLSEVKATFVKPVELDLDKSSDFDSFVKYVSDGLTLRVVPSYSLPGGYKGFTHFSATQYERALKVDRLTLWGDVVVRDLPNGFVKSATVFTDGDLLPLAVEVEWSKLNNASFFNKYKYYKNGGLNGWVVHRTDDTSQRLPTDVLLEFLKATKEALGERVVLSLEKRANYNVGTTTNPLVVRVVNEPTSRHDTWNGLHRVTHEFTANNARVLLMKLGDRVLRAHHLQTFVRSVDTFWYKNVLLFVKLTVAGGQVATASGPSATAPDTFVYFKNDHKEDLMPFTGQVGNLNLTAPDSFLLELATPFMNHYQLDVSERTLRNSADVVKHLPALYVVDTSVPEGFARYNLYVLDHTQGVRLSKLLYHGRDVSTGNFNLPEYNVFSVYVFTPVGHFSPFLLEFHVRSPNKLLFYYYHLNQFGEWVALETGLRQLTAEELHNKLSVLGGQLGNFTVVDVSKTEGTYYGLNRLDVTKFSFPGVRGFVKYLHKPHDGNSFTVSKFVNKGVVLENLPVLKVTHVAVYTTRNGKPLLLELRVGGRYKFYASNANGTWFEERLPSGDLLSALNRAYDEHVEVARQTGDLVSLHLSADFVREYVLTEGKVGDFDGAVAVPAEEPEPVPAPQAERLLPEDPTGAETEPDTVRPEPTLQGATRPTQAPSLSVTRSHVLNPVLYVESDRLAYSYASYGKTVFVTRRDDMFHGYNVTVHKLPENEPFVLRRVVFLGTEFDLELGNAKLLSATSFSFLHTPLVLKFVFEDGNEKFFSFNFSTQKWAALEVTDLEEKLDRLNYDQNKMVVLDLGREVEYEVFGQAFVVEKSTFDQYTRLTTKTKSAALSNAKRREKKQKKKMKRVAFKAQLKAELEQRKLKLKELENVVEEKKKVYDDLLAEWRKVDSAAVNLHKKVSALTDVVDKLKKTVVDLGKEFEDAEALGNVEKAKEKKKELEAKKTELAAKKEELAKLVPQKPGASEKTPEQEEAEARETEADVVNREQAKLKEALDKLLNAGKVFKVAETLKEPTEPGEHLAKVKTAVLVAEHFKDAAAQVDALKKEVANVEELNHATGVVKKVKGMVVDVNKLEEALTAVNTVTELASYVTENNLTNLVADAKTVKQQVDLVEPVPELTVGTESEDHSAKFTSAVEKNTSLKQYFADKVEPFKTLHQKFLELRTKVELYVEKQKAVYDFNVLLHQMLVYDGKTESLSKKYDETEEFFDDFKDLPVRAKKLVNFEVTTVNTVSEDVTGKLNTLVAAHNELGEALKPEALKNFEKVTLFVQKLKNVDLAPGKLEEAKNLAEKLKEKYNALETADENTNETESNKVDEFVLAANNLKEAYTNIGTKLKDVFEFVKNLREPEDNLNKFNDANEQVGRLKEHVAVFVVAEKVAQAVTNETEKRKALFTAAKTFKQNVKVASFAADKLVLNEAFEALKKLLDALKQELEAKAPEQFKLGAESAKELHENAVADVMSQDELVDAATKRHDLYETEVEDSDSEEEGSFDKSLLFGFGGLRVNGKDVVHAGLPLGTHPHTLNAYFPAGFTKPLMLQLKYKESEDLDEPVLERLLAPPPADALSVADRQTVPVVNNRETQAPGPNGPAGNPPTEGANSNQGAQPQQQTPGNATTPAAAGVTGTVQKVTELLQLGLQNTSKNVGLEKHPVVNPVQATPAPVLGQGQLPPGVPVGQVPPGMGPSGPRLPPPPQGMQQPGPLGPPPSGPRLPPPAPPARMPGPPGPGSEVHDTLVYPGRFFVWDVDGTWKHFVPEGKGALKAKLDELRAKHALTVDLDLAKEPGTRRKGEYLVGTDNFVVRRVLYSSAYKLTREGDAGNNLQGADQKPVAGPNVVNLNDYDSSVKFFPTFHYHWYLHHKVPTVGAENKVLDPLPAFRLEGLNLNGVPLDLDEQAAAVLTQVNSVSAVLNAHGTPLALFVYKPVQLNAAVQHNYLVLVLKGEKYVVDDTFGNHFNLLYKLEHTAYDWASDPAFEEFRALFLKKLEDVDNELNPSYVVDFGATSHYRKDGMVVNVDVSQAFGVLHVSYTPGLVPQQNTAPDFVPAFVVQKVFWNDTVFKGFKLPSRNVLHVTVFHWKFMHLLREGVDKLFETFPLLVEFSYRNENNRLVHHYYQYVGGDRFELHSKTKLRLTAAEVADVVKNVAFNNLRVANAQPNLLNVDLSLQFNHYTPGHKLLVDKLFKRAVTPADAPAPPKPQPQTFVNGFVPEGYVLYRFTLHKDDPGFTNVKLFFGDFWKHQLTRSNYKEFFAYVKADDRLPVLVAMGYAETTGAMKYDWLGLQGNRPFVLFETLTVSPVLETDKPKVEAELNKLTVNVDLWLERKPTLWTTVAPGLTVKLSPVKGVSGFPKVPKQQEQVPPKTPAPGPAPQGNQVTPQQPPQSPLTPKA